MRGQRGVSGFLHRDFDQPALSRALALEQRRGHRGVEVDAGEEIDYCGSGLDRRTVGKASRADQARDRLDRQIHCQIVAIRPAEAIARAGSIDETRINRAQLRPADAQPVHCTR
jgi:hypothetical protein